MSGPGDGHQGADAPGARGAWTWTPADTLRRVVESVQAALDAEAALYLMDIDGSRAVRAAGSDSFPDALEHGVGVGKDVPLENGPLIEAAVESLRPGASAAILTLRGRGVAVLAADGPPDALREVAGEAAAMLEIADGLTDEMLRARLRRPITVEGMIQQTLLPPEVALLDDVEIAGSVLPAYDVGGDWLDHARNDEGVWLAVGDAVGKGLEAATLSALTVGALRAARANGQDPAGCAQTIHRALVAASAPTAYVTAVIALLEPRSGQVRWVNAGHPAPVVCGTDGAWRTLAARPQMPLGLYEADRRFACGEAVVAPGERLVLFSDGVIERRGDDGEQFGVSGLVAVLDDSARAGVAVAVANLQNSVLKASSSPLTDDSTVLAAEIRPAA